MDFITWIGKSHEYSMNISNKWKTFGNFFGGIASVATAISYIKKTESFIMDSVHQLSEEINETEVYTVAACVALTIGGYTSGFILGNIGHISDLSWQGIKYIANSTVANNVGGLWNRLTRTNHSEQNNAECENLVHEDE